MATCQEDSWFRAKVLKCDEGEVLVSEILPTNHLGFNTSAACNMTIPLSRWLYLFFLGTQCWFWWYFFSADLRCSHHEGWIYGVAFSSCWVLCEWKCNKQQKVGIPICNKLKMSGWQLGKQLIMQQDSAACILDPNIFNENVHCEIVAYVACTLIHPLCCLWVTYKNSCITKGVVLYT